MLIHVQLADLLLDGLVVLAFRGRLLRDKRSQQKREAEETREKSFQLKTSAKYGGRILLQAALLKGHVFAHDQPARRHLAQLRKNPLHVFFSVNEGKNDGQLAAGVYKRRGFHAAPARESRDR